jgi:hypothetical protein
MAAGAGHLHCVAADQPVGCCGINGLRCGDPSVFIPNAHQAPPVGRFQASPAGARFGITAALMNNGPLVQRAGPLRPYSI